MIDEKTKELIAIGASIGAHCQPCLIYHLGKAKELGIDSDLIQAAVEVGHQVEKGAMVAMRRFSSDLMKADEEPQESVSCCGPKNSPKGGCCG